MFAASDVVLVTGGVGYVGAHVCLALYEAGFSPVAYDNLSNGHREFARWGPLEVGDIRDASRLDEVIEKYKPVAIVHFAGLIEVAESVLRPGTFYDNNVTGSLTLIEAARRGGITEMVFSSTCATYGNPQNLPLDEQHPQNPINPYGRTKLIIEQALSDYSKYADFRSVSLRYFNAAGADETALIGERHDPETHAIPLALQSALGLRAVFKIFGSDYDTRDGTAIRDYVHVSDLASAHVKALQYLRGGGGTTALNLGTGSGTSVSELVEVISRVTGEVFPVESTTRRQGDAPCLVAENSLALSVLNWAPTRTIEDIIRSAWAWHSAEHRAALVHAGRNALATSK